MKQSLPLISIIVPVYRTEQYLRQCVDSLLAQTYNRIEIILVDDGSPDGSGGICEEYAAKDPRVKVIHQENGGLSAARNTGLDHATGEYVMFVDSDDWISPDNCEKAVAVARARDVDVVIWSYRREYPDRSLDRHIFAEEQAFTGEAYRRLFLKVLGDTVTPETLDSLSSACNKLYKLEGVAQSVRFVDTKIIGTEDLLYNVQVFLQAQNAYYLREAFYHYRKDNQNSLTKTYKKELLPKRKVLFGELRKAVSDCRDQDYEKALNKRVALDILGQSLNVVRSGETPKTKRRLIREILHDEVYGPALRELSTAGMKIHWKLYYGCAKRGAVMGVYLLTLAIIALR
jgi:glycosyltransferase EpsH